MLYQIQETVRSRRLHLGITQGELAHQASVSLALIQQVEAGLGNPSLNTVEKLFGVLGLSANFTENEPDWEKLIFFGVPLTGGKLKAGNFQKDLPPALSLACAWVIKKNHEREQIALHSFLCAVHDHYPVFFKRRLSKSPAIHALINTKFDAGRVIKLRRLALARISKFL